MTCELACTVVGNLDLAALSGLDGLLGVFGNGASAAGNSLVNDQWLVAYIGELKHTSDLGTAFGERAEIVGQLVELDFCLCAGETYSANEHQRNEYHLFHIFIFFNCFVNMT